MSETNNQCKDCNGQGWYWAAGRKTRCWNCNNFTGYN